MAQTFSIGDKVQIDLSSLSTCLSKEYYDRWRNSVGTIKTITIWHGTYEVKVGISTIKISDSCLRLLNEQLMLFDLE